MREPTLREIESFKQILNQELEVYQAMAHHLEEKRQIIIKGDLEALMKIDDDLNKLTQPARELEENRQSLMVELGGTKNDTLKSFINTLSSDEERQIVTGLRSQLVQETESVKRLTTNNKDLLTQSIRLIEQSVDFIASILSPQGASYSDNRNGHCQADNPQNTGYTASSTISREA